MIGKSKSRVSVLLALTALAVWWSCEDRINPPLSQSVVVSIHVIPDSARVEIGKECTFYASALYENGDSLLHVVSWQLSVPIGTLNVLKGDSVVFHAEKEGETAVIAKYGNRADSARVVAYDPVVSISVMPESVRLAIGKSVEFTATAKYVDGSVSPLAVDWALEGDAIGTLSAYHGESVEFRATGEGTGRIVANRGSRSDSARITIFTPYLVSIFLDPVSAIVERGDELVFTAYGVYDTGDTSAISVAWSLLDERIGVINLSVGKTTVFRAVSVGRTALTAKTSGFQMEADVRTVFASPYVLFDDHGVSDSLGVFCGEHPDTIVLNVVYDPQAPEGQDVLEGSFTVRANGWAGLYFEEGEFGADIVAYMCHFFPEGHLRFSIKSNVDVRVGIRSQNIEPGDEDSKVWLHTDGYAVLNGNWEDVTIPLRDFVRLEPRLRCDQIEVFFMAAAEGPHYGIATSGVFRLDNIRWTKD